MKCSQILLNHDDFDDRKRLNNLNYTINALLDYDVVPIINENDVVLLAVSGGRDSMCLLDTMATLSEMYDFEVAELENRLCDEHTFSDIFEKVAKKQFDRNFKKFRMQSKKE